jgi:CTP:molybdopterin cytidylyltransferase MocA
MGSPKALLAFGDETAAGLALHALAEGGCAPVALVLGAAAAEVRAGVAIPANAEVVVNERWEQGRSGSLQAGIRALFDAPAWVVLPVDHPLVTSMDVRALVGAWRESRAPVVRLVREGRGGHPVLLDAGLRGELLGLGMAESLRNVVRAHRDEEVTVAGSPGTVLDVNTPEDYRAAREAFRELRPPPSAP